MADAQSTGPIDHLIPVEYDAASSTLTLSLSQVGIKPGDRVIWEFRGLPAGWTPWIEFRPDAGFLGPLEDLTQSANAVWGVCKADQPASSDGLAYRASARRGTGTAWETGSAAIYSNAGRLIIGPVETGTARQFTITRSGASLSVTPEGVDIWAGDIVEWVFENIDAGADPWRPRVDFHQYDGEGKVEDLYLGPFTSLTTSMDRVRGMGNNYVKGTYYFQVSAVRVTDGSVLWISSPDPAIDNRGSVVDPSGG
jgi:hypothetical protein